LLFFLYISYLVLYAAHGASGSIQEEVP